MSFTIHVVYFYISNRVQMFTLVAPSNYFSMNVWLIINALTLLLLLVFVILSKKDVYFFNPTLGKNRIRQNIWLIITLSLSVIWLIKAQLLTNLYLHFIGASLAYLLLGFPLANLALALVLVFTSSTRQIPIEIFGLQYLLSVLLPLSLAYAFHYIVKKILPNRLFLFIFVRGFFITAITMMITVFANLYVLDYFGFIQLFVGNEVFWVSPILLGWGEAFLTGMITALISVYRPEWLFEPIDFVDV